MKSWQRPWRRHLRNNKRQFFKILKYGTISLRALTGNTTRRLTGSEIHAELVTRLDAQRRKMDSYETSEDAFDIACRLYFADAFGFLRRVLLILVSAVVFFIS